MTVRISRLAAYKTQKLLDHLEDEWSVASKNRFIAKMTSCFEGLKRNPEGFPKSEIKPELRKVVITRQTSVLYTI